MAESYTQVAPDSTGNKIRTRTRTIGANTVHEQAAWTAACDTWFVCATTVAFATAKVHLAIMNQASATKVIKIRKLFAINMQVTAVTGVAMQFSCATITTMTTTGTAITPVKADSTQGALETGVKCQTNNTVTPGSFLWPWMSMSEENTATQPFTVAQFQQWANIMPEGLEIRELTLNPGEGFAVTQSIVSIVGMFGWLLVFTIDP